MMESTAAILPARDFDETSAFYQKIGFKETGRWPDQYLIVTREHIELHFFHYPEFDPSSSCHAAYIRTTDVDSYSDKLAKLGIPEDGLPRFGPAEDKDWGMREMIIFDPSGTLLRIGQYL